jgi:hypothetical protein
VSRKRKLLRKVLRGSKNIQFSEFILLIGYYGFHLDRITGSHHIFSHSDVPQSIADWQ